MFFLSATPAEVESCLAAGADVNARSAGLGYTPLHWAVRFSDNPAVITTLLDAGAEATAQDLSGNTPWDYAKDREELQGSDAYRRLNEAQTLAEECGGWNTGLGGFFYSATLEQVTTCLEAGAEVNPHSGDYTPLQRAAWVNVDLAIIEALLDAGADVNARNEIDWTPLHYAACCSDPAIIRALLDAGAEANARHKGGLTPWFYAKGREELEGSDVYERLREGSQGLAPGCRGWNTEWFFYIATLEEIKGCLVAGADVNARGEYGTNPLHNAAEFTDNPAVLEALVAAGAEVNARNEIDWTPLHFAAQENNSPAIIRALLDAGAEVNARSEGGSTPLHFAAFSSDDPTVIQILVAAGTEVNARNEGGSTPLHFAAQGGTPAIIRALVEARGDVNARGKDGWTPLHYAVRFSDNPAVITALLDAGADAVARNDDGYTPWDYAQGNAALRVTDAYQQLETRVLAAACAGWNTEEFFKSATLTEVKGCLAAGAELNAQGKDGGTPLHLAATFTDNPAIIGALLDAGAGASVRDDNGLTPWDYAAGREELEGSYAYRRLAEQALAAKCARWNTLEFFESATLMEVKGCLASGVEVNARAEGGWTPLHRAAWFSDNPAVVEVLLDAGADVNARDEDGDTPLHNAAWFDPNPAVIEALLDAGAEVNARDESGWTPLHSAAATSDSPVVIAVLLDAGAEVNARNESGWTPWDFAKDREALKGTNAYRRLAAQAAAADCEGWDTPEFFGSATAAVVRSCLAAGADVNARGRLGGTPLHWAAFSSDDPAIIQALVTGGARVNARDEDGNTPLVYAAQGSTPAVVRALIAAGADVNARGKNGWTSLYHAVLYNANPAVISALVSAGADVNARDENGYTPLRLVLSATSIATPDVITALLDAGADVNARYGESRWTPLHTAAAGGDNPAIIRALVAGGANVNARDEDGQAPLHIAAAYNDAPAVIRALVGAGAWLEVRTTEYDTTPLHHAAAYNDAPAVITALLDTGANAAARTNWGATPWDLAQDNEALEGTDAYWRLNEERFR